MIKTKKTTGFHWIGFSLGLKEGTRIPPCIERFTHGIYAENNTTLLMCERATTNGLDEKSNKRAKRMICNDSPLQIFSHLYIAAAKQSDIQDDRLLAAALKQSWRSTKRRIRRMEHF